MPREKPNADLLARNSGLSARVQLRISVKPDSPNKLWARVESSIEIRRRGREWVLLPRNA